MEPRRSTPPTGTLKAMAYRQLCAVAREQCPADPGMRYDEWAARVKDRLARLGFASPRPGEITAAMSAVEHAIQRTSGPHAVPSTPPRPRVSAAQRHELGPPTSAEWRHMARIVRSLLTNTAEVVAAPSPWKRFAGRDRGARPMTRTV